jgi:hypothetical protein
VDDSKGEKDELDESDKVLLRATCWFDKTMFLLPISTIRLISSEKPLILLEKRGTKVMKRISTTEGKENYG